jgi:hypothetical protein
MIAPQPDRRLTMTKFKTDLFKTEHAAASLSDTELDAVAGGAGGMTKPPSKPPVLPPHHGPTDPRQA